MSDSQRSNDDSPTATAAASSRAVRLDPSWRDRLAPEFAQPYMEALRAFLLERGRAGASIYPPGRLIFNALDSTPFDQVRVVILGQDPYHGPGQSPWAELFGSAWCDTTAVSGQYFQGAAQ